MWVRNRSHLASSVVRCVDMSRLHSPFLLSQTETAVQFSPDASCVPRSQVLVTGSVSLHFIRDLCVSRSASLRVSNCVHTDPEHDAKMDGSVSTAEKSKRSPAEQLKRAVKEYGATVIVFHTCISLFTLGLSYTAVSRYPHCLWVYLRSAPHHVFQQLWHSWG